MSDNNSLEIKKIVAPSLSSSSYGKDLNECFNNINENFKILSNHDFIKGDQGQNIYTEKIYLSENGVNLTDVGLQVFYAVVDYILSDGTKCGELKAAIDEINNNSKYNISEINEILSDSEWPELNPVGGYSLLDNFIADDLFFLFVKSNDPSTTNAPKVVGALNSIVFKDARFNHKDLAQTAENNKNSYTNALDTSCTIYVKECKDDSTGGTSVVYGINHDSPNLYFDGNIGMFCWELYGEKTGIPAQGPGGLDGRTDSNIHIVEIVATKEKLDEISNAGIRGISVSITGYQIVGEFKKLENATAEDAEKINEMFNVLDPAFVYLKNSNEEIQGVYVTYISQVTASEGSLDVRVYLSEGYRLNTKGDENIVNTTMNRVDFKGFYFPINKGKGDISTRHMIWSSDVPNLSELADGQLNGNSTQQGVTNKYLNIAPIKYNEDASSSLGGVSWTKIDASVSPELNICYPKINIFNNDLDFSKSYVTLEGNTVNIERGVEGNTRLTIPCGIDVSGNNGFCIYKYNGSNNIFSTQDLDIRVDNDDSDKMICISNSFSNISLDNEDIIFNALNDGSIQLNGEVHMVDASVVGDFTVNGKINIWNTNNEEYALKSGKIQTSGLSVTNAIGSKVLELDGDGGYLSLTTSDSIVKLTGDSIEFKHSSPSIVSDGPLTIDANANITKELKVNGVYVDTPVGSIVMWVSNVIPEHWTICDGKICSETENPEIYNGLKDFDNGAFKMDGDEGKIQIPDFRGCFPYGVNSKKDGEEFRSIEVNSSEGDGKIKIDADNLPHHEHLVHNITMGDNHNAFSGDDVQNALLNEDGAYILKDGEIVKNSAAEPKGSITNGKGLLGDKGGVDLDNDTFPYLDTATDTPAGQFKNEPINYLPPRYGVYFIMKYE